MSSSASGTSYRDPRGQIVKSIHHGHAATTLRLLIPEADPNGIPLAERAIDELIAAQDGGPRQIHALRLLQERLTPIWESATGKQLNFVNVLFDYMAMSLKALAPPKPRKRVGGCK
jgi:hypothetical protein